MRHRLLGTPDPLRHGLQLSFFDFQPDLEFFGTLVLPLMRQAGLRE